MRIGIDAHFLEQNYGGLTTFLKGILNTLINPDFKLINTDKKFDFFLFFQHVKPVKLVKQLKLSEQLNKLNKLKELNKLSWLRWFHFVLPRQLKKYKIDLFFSINHFLPLKKPTEKEVVVIHDLAWKVSPNFKNFSFRAYANLFQEKSIQRADKIIADSENTKKDIMKYYGNTVGNTVDNTVVNSIEKKIEVIYLAADEKFRPRELSQESKLSLLRKLSIFDNLSSLKSLKNLPAIILYVGRIERRKNIQGIIEIARRVSNFEKLSKLKFILFGPIGLGGREYLKEIQKDKNIEYKGFIRDEDLPYIYNLAKIFLFPSLYEGFGLPVLEAMQSGIPVLTSNTSSLPGVVGDGGLMHDPDDYKGFARDIIRLLEDKKFYQEMRQRGIEQAKKFSWRKSAETLVQIFNKI